MILFLKPTKYEFNKTKVEYLGMVIEEGKISMDPGKLCGIQDWPSPTTVKELEDFWVLETFINDLFDISQTRRNLWMIS